ncbi:MAG: DUF488 domain-containing protein, partial [Nitrosopumilus sp.]
MSRGVSKDRTRIDLWLKEITLSDKLRKWYDHDPQKWNEWQKRYKIELVDKLDSLEIIKTLEKKQKIVTLLYAAKDKKLTHA